MNMDEQNIWDGKEAIIEQQFFDLKVDGRIDFLLMFYCDQKYKHLISPNQRIMLKYLFSDYYPIVDGSNDFEDGSLLDETLRIMEEDKLITRVLYEAEGWVSKPTSLGYRINERGGWLKHLNEAAAKENLLSDQVKSTIAANALSGKTIENLEKSNSIQRGLL